MNRQFQIPASMLLILFLSLFFSVNSMAAGAEIKERMRSRLPTIDSMKAQGVIGENSKGFLEFRPGKSGDQALVNDENTDRRVVYQAIAKQQGVTPEIVGPLRAKQIAEIAEKGTWLQKPDGAWYQK